VEALTVTRTHHSLAAHDPRLDHTWTTHAEHAEHADHGAHAASHIGASQKLLREK